MEVVFEKVRTTQDTQNIQKAQSEQEQCVLATGLITWTGNIDLSKAGGREGKL